MSKAPHYHIEHDGRIYLVEDRGVLRLPIASDPLPFHVREVRRVSIQGHDIVYAHPLIASAPPEWPWKDDVMFAGNVDALARASVHRTMPRVVAKGALLRDGRNVREILLVKPETGFFSGRWSLPGGYLDYGESPEECVVREVAEELGVACRIDGYVGMDSGVVASGVHFLSILYRGALLSEQLSLKRDEIADARWFALGDAVAEVGHTLTGRALLRLAPDAPVRT